jgi:ATP-dependent RNA helicase RhlE
MSQVKFSDFNMDTSIQKTLQSIGYQTPTPIQQQTIPLVLDGHDVLGIAQTGTGKTAAFCLPIIDSLHRNHKKRESMCPRALILTPTRELAIQIHQNLEIYGQNLAQEYAVIFGGVSQGKQVSHLRRGVDVLVATPGRLLDLVGQGYLKLNRVEVFVLDEADRMLDMGFVRDIRDRIVPLLSTRRRNLFFSATMPTEIETLANKILVNPQTVEVTPPSTMAQRVEQSVMFVDKKDKINLLIHLLKNFKKGKTLVFVEMKHVANRVTEKLLANGISAAAIHGNKSQGARQKAIQDFTSGELKVLVATDIASRGIDIDGITHVINYELSNIAESYVHRVGRTARAGADGIAISLVTGDEKSYLANVEKVTQQEININTNQPYHSDTAMSATIVKVGKAKKKIESHRDSGSRGKKKTSGRPRSGDKPSHTKKHRSAKKASSSTASTEGSTKKKRSRRSFRRKP